MRITNLTASDAWAYKALMLEAYSQSPDAFTLSLEEALAWSDDRWHERAGGASGQAVTLGGFAEDALVGSARLEFDVRLKARHKAHLTAVYVQPGWRGRGLGRTLVTEALRQAQHRTGIVLVNLSVTEGNLAAQALYGALGFEVYAKEPMAIRGNGAYLTKILMLKMLRPAAERPT